MATPFRQRKRSRSGDKRWNVIRKFFATLAILGLIGLSLYSYWQVLQLRQANITLVADNALLRKELSRHHGDHVRRDVKFAKELPLDPVADAQTRIGLAESALSHGNIGDAVSQCKLAGNDISEASTSTSSSVKGSVSALKMKLDFVQHETTDLLQKLGA